MNLGVKFLSGSRNNSRLCLFKSPTVPDAIKKFMANEGRRKVVWGNSRKKIREFVEGGWHQGYEEEDK